MSFDNPGFVVVEVAVELLSRIMAVELVNSCLFLCFVSFDNPGFVVVEVAVELLSRIMAVELVNSVCF